jgi:hypothetical protein
MFVVSVAGFSLTRSVSPLVLAPFVASFHRMTRFVMGTSVPVQCVTEPHWTIRMDYIKLYPKIGAAAAELASHSGITEPNCTATIRVLGGWAQVSSTFIRCVMTGTGDERTTRSVVPPSRLPSLPRYAVPITTTSIPSDFAKSTISSLGDPVRK